MAPTIRAFHTDGALAGVASVALGAGLGELVGALVGGSPVAAVGSVLIDLAPPWGKDLAISLFGTGDKAALIAAVAIVLLLVGAATGLLARRSVAGAQTVVVVAGLLGVGAAVSRADASTLAAAPPVVGAAVTLLALHLLLRRATASPAPVSGPVPASPPPSEGVGHHASRREFLVWTTGAAAAGLLAAAGGWALRAGSRAVDAVRTAIALPRAPVPVVVPATADLGITGLAPVLTPTADFYRIDTALAPPQIDPATWRLRIHGLVDREVEIGWDELLALPLEESVTTLTCVSNEVGGDLVGTARWLGYPIRHLLAQAGVHADADMVLSTSADGFTAGTPLETLTDERNAILAVGMNGEPLPIAHGFPVRMVVPGLYGYVSATKWVTDLEVTRFADAEGYWISRGWAARGPIKLASRIDVPRRGAAVTAGETVIAGVAWQQHVGVRGVQVRIDDGEWQDAALATAISDDTWVQWSLPWRASAGRHTLTARAIGVDGTPQTQDAAPPAPDGATGWPSVAVTVA
ncbi:molybdopterin-dependent oxidoreductase [Microbacterium dextranolyticum]|uniref:Oxidoreductase n=1 Tax=Microbacterium dextranolyticum TaxID=36806 RepID=A0A9W6HLR7_9MICO|nr:molybdopterin-dependent oxidoreductase [Microbacterium dextranolyticum]MBM7464177.1 DMSO/TMAO reductase YedYZ molybdopterin-dependent catalytic subunit [Microbacterium dextranolyticum]GLJ95172.1 putative oxidoreductase [Microbacterium dextranolyticum]